MVAFSTESAIGIGLGANGEIFITDAIAIAPGIIFYLPKDDLTYLEVNVNGQYHFDLGGSFQPYALVGLNWSRVEVDFFGSEFDDSEVGLNLGGGVNYDTGGSIVPFGELRFTTAFDSPLMIMLGAKFALN